MSTIIKEKVDAKEKVIYMISGYVDKDNLYRNDMANGIKCICDAYYSSDTVRTAFFDESDYLIVTARREIDSAIHGICELFGMMVIKKTTESSTTKVEIKIEEWP